MDIWHKIVGYRAHVGSGKREEETIFAYVPDVLSALNFYRELKGVKRNTMPKIILPLPKDKQGELEKAMIESGVNLNHAKKIGYFPERSFSLDTPKI